jgi:tripartite-type tricarboxylate transporter receptor subunit TctC
MKPRNKPVFFAMISGVAAFIAASCALSQNYPSKTVRIVVPFAPGGHTDIIARTLGQKYTETMGQSFVVDNRVGAGGVIGTDIVAKAAPDGHTLLVMPLPFAVLPSLYVKLPYDAERDFTPVTLIAAAPLLLFVHPSVPVKNARELIYLAKAQPGNLNYGSAGPGSTAHLATEYFSLRAAVKMTHVPYKGGVPALTDLLGGNLSLMIENMPLALPYLKLGRVRALAVTDLHRTSLLPDVPTLAESGLPGYQVIGWNVLFVPAGTPRGIVDRLHVEAVRVLAMADVKERLARLGVDGVGNNPEQAAAFVKAETAKWGRIVRDSGMTVE